MSRGKQPGIPLIVSENSGSSLKETDRLSIFEFAEIFGFLPAGLIAAIERNRLTIKKPFYSIQDLAARWRCSRGTVYNVLRESEFKLLDLSNRGKDKGKRIVPAAVVEQIEQGQMRSLSEAPEKSKAA